MSNGLIINQLDFSYGEKNILRHINLTVEPGEFVCLLGPSGCGKTTLLRMMAGLTRPDAGSLSWNGREIDGPSPERGVVFQDYSLFPWLTLLSNVTLAIRKGRRDIRRPAATELAREYLQLVGLGDSEEKYPFELSGGMRQRGAIARALAAGPDVLLLDEPFGALDPATRARLQDLLLDLCAENGSRLTVVFVTHDIREAVFMGDRVVVLGSTPGRVIADYDAGFGLPRERGVRFGDERVLGLCRDIEAIFHRDMIKQLGVEYGAGEGI